MEGVQWSDFSQVVVTSRLRVHSRELKKDSTRFDLRMFTFSRSVVHKWNDLPTEVVAVKALKKELETLLKIPIEGHQNRTKARTVTATEFTEI